MTRRFFIFLSSLFVLLGFKVKKSPMWDGKIHRYEGETKFYTGVDPAYGTDETHVTIIGVDIDGNHVCEQHTIPAEGGKIESKHVFNEMPKFEIIRPSQPMKAPDFSMGVAHKTWCPKAGE